MISLVYKEIRSRLGSGILIMINQVVKSNIMWVVEFCKEKNMYSFMRIRQILLIVICFCCQFTIASASNMIQVVYEKAETTKGASIEKELKATETLKAITGLMTDEFHLTYPITIVMGGEDGPLFDSEKNEIIIPYAIVGDIREQFVAAEYSKTGLSVDEATMDTLQHMIFHEIAHALIYQYQFPVLGKEEDAADNLATVLLIEFFKDGQEIVLSAADFFEIISSQVREMDEEDFWDEHSLDLQRYYSMMCEVYGSDPMEYSSLKKEIGFSDERAELCVEEYENMAASCFSLLRLLQPQNNSKRRLAIDTF